MATPFKPTLVSPGQRAASGTTVVIQFQFNAFGAGETLGTYSIRRRRIAPTIGTVDYWNGTAWAVSQTWLSPGSTVYDKQIVTVSTTGWSNNEVYEWSVDTRDALNSAGGFANNNIVDIHSAPTVTAAVSSANETRPQIVWRFSGGTGRRQKSYRWYLYSAAIYNQSGFDPSVAYWQSLATWGMAEPEVGSLIFRKRVGTDLTNATTYRMYGIVTDDTDLTSGWVNAGNFTTSFTGQATPDVLITPQPDDGVVRLELGATFNLLDENSSVFTNNVGKWVPDFNCQLSLNSTPAYVRNGSTSMKVTMGGASYEYLDTTYTTYTAMDTAIGTYATQASTQMPTLGQSRMSTGNSNPNSIPITPSTNYSAVASVFPLVNETLRLSFRWFKADGSESSTAETAGTAVACLGGQWRDISVFAATSPADAAYARVSILCTTAAVGDVYYVDTVAMARADSVEWSSGGTSVDVGFVVQRSDDRGVTWKYIWNNSHDNPFSTSSGAFVGTYFDRSPPVGNGLPVKYRVAAVSRKTTNPLYSDTVEIEVPALEARGWWLRSVEDPTKDLKILVSKFSFNEKPATQVYSPENSTHEVVVHTSEPISREVSGQIWLVNSADYEKARRLFTSSDTLYLQRNIGDGFYFKSTGGWSADQRASASRTKTPNHVHTVSFTGTVVAAP